MCNTLRVRTASSSAQTIPFHKARTHPPTHSDCSEQSCLSFSDVYFVMTPVAYVTQRTVSPFNGHEGLSFLKTHVDQGHQYSSADCRRE